MSSLTRRLRTLPIIDGEDSVTVDLAEKTVKVEWYRSNLPLWFANIFGSPTMGLRATATARASQAGTANCLKPVALPDMWNNVNNDNGKAREEIGGNRLRRRQRRTHSGITSTPTTMAWSTPAKWSRGHSMLATCTIRQRPGYGTPTAIPTALGTPPRPQDYGRQVLVQTFDPKNAIVGHFIFSDLDRKPNTRGDRFMAAAIRGERCTTAQLGTEYRQGNGANNPLA